MSSSVMCIAPGPGTALQIVSRLKDCGFPDDDISVLYPDMSTSRDCAFEKHSKSAQGVVWGGIGGGVTGGAVGLVAWLGMLPMPAMLPLLAGGPLLAALSSAAVGGFLGGIIGGLVGMRIPEIVAKRYEGKIKDGSILISVHAETDDEAAVARRVFEHGHATGIATATEAKVPGSA